MRNESLPNWLSFRIAVPCLSLSLELSATLYLEYPVQAEDVFARALVSSALNKDDRPWFCLSPFLRMSVE